MGNKMITDRAILDNIIEQLKDNIVYEGVATANYDDGNIFIEAAVQWTGHEDRNYITIDGVPYLEGTYKEIDGWQDLDVTAYVGDNEAEVDFDYLDNNLIY